MPDGFALPYSTNVGHAKALGRFLFVRRSLTYGMWVLSVQLVAHDVDHDGLRLCPTTNEPMYPAVRS